MELHDHALGVPHHLHCEWHLAGCSWSSTISPAALSNASKELKEAAVIDGTNIIQQSKAVEWPAIRDTVLIQLIMSVGNIMSVGFDKAYALQTDLNLASYEII